MPPKFQSTFIPRGPIAGASAMSPSLRTRGGSNFISSIAFFIFAISIILALGVFGYRFYLEYRISNMSRELAEAKAALNPEAIEDLVDLDTRLTSTQTLVKSHKLMTPLFEFLESVTPRSVRFSGFKYAVGQNGPEIELFGQARGYSALALVSEMFDQSRYFRSPVFANLNLNQKGEVEFAFKAEVLPELLSFIPPTSP